MEEDEASEDKAREDEVVVVKAGAEEGVDDLGHNDDRGGEGADGGGPW